MELNERRITIKAANDILKERERQIEEEGFDQNHDDLNTSRELASAAACYAVSGTMPIYMRGADPVSIEILRRLWPASWAWKWWKPKDPRSDLVKAGALILAEIERLDRLENKNDVHRNQN